MQRQRSVPAAPSPPAAAPPPLLAQADALSRMTVELNVRALAAQAARVERELRDVVARTAHNDAFRRQHEHRLADMAREMLAVRARTDELRDARPPPFEAVQRDLRDLRDRLMAEVDDLRAAVTAALDRMDTLPTPEQADELLRLAARRHHARRRAPGWEPLPETPPPDQRRRRTGSLPPVAAPG